MAAGLLLLPAGREGAALSSTAGRSRLDLSALLTAPDRAWTVRLPAENSRAAAVDADFLDGRLRLAVRLLRPSRIPVRLSVCLANRHGWTYKSARDYLLSDRAAARVALDLSPWSGDLVPAGSERPWCEAAGAPLAWVRLELFSAARYEGGVEVSAAEVTGASGRARACDEEGPTVRGLEVLPAAPEAGRLVELCFGLSEAFADPFDASCPLRAEFSGPDGSAHVTPAFASQDFAELREGFGGRAVPVGPLRWKARFCPPRPGRYRASLKLDGRTIADVPFQVAAHRARPSESAMLPGGRFLRDLATVNGECFLRSLPADPGRPLAVFAAGQFRPQPPPDGGTDGWIAPLEWTAQWGGYLGLGRYNLEAAWRLDRVLERAARAGVRLPLFLNCDGQLSAGDKYGRTADRYNWRSNPLSARLGGPLAAPGDYYRSERAAELSEALFGYLLARYGAHPAVERLVLAAGLAADGAADWHERIGQHLADLAGVGAVRLASFSPAAARPSRQTEIGSFEPDAPRGWRLDRAGPTSLQAAYSTEVHSQGARSLRLEAAPGGAGSEICVYNLLNQDLGDYDRLSLDVFVPPDGPEHARAMVYLRDREWCWYERLLPGELRRGDWNRLVLDLREGRNGLAGQGFGRERPWDGYSRQRIRELGLRVFSNSDRPAPVYLDNVVLDGGLEELEPEKPLAILDLTAEGAAAPQLFSKVEYSFRLSRTFANPFDPECVDVRARVLTPSGRLYTVPGFFYQGYVRRMEREAAAGKETVAVPGGAEHLEPSGGSLWKVRLSAAEPGEHRVSLEVLVPDGKGGMAAAAVRKGLTFTAVHGGRHGPVRRAADGRHFEHADGSFFLPLGMSIRSPSDTRAVDQRRNPEVDPLISAAMFGAEPTVVHRDGGRVEYFDLLSARGTAVFDEYLERSAAAGMNWLRVWTCPWWLGLEWDHRYPGYEGAGRYNLENAWRLDHVLETSERLGVYLQLCLTNHGQVCAKIDRQWDFHPYNRLMPAALWNPPDRPASDPLYARPGGFLDWPQDYFTDERARKLTRNRLRYTVARWGYSPNVFAWALMSEVEFTGGQDFQRDGNWDRGRFPLQTAWHREMAQYLRAVDPCRHMITTHFSHPCNGLDLWELPEIDYVQSNAYSSFEWLGGGKNPNATVGAPTALERYYERYMARYARPVLIGEWGGHWFGNYRAVLDAELHTGLWSQAAIPMGGVTGWWWWLHVHFRDRYGEFAAVARFLRGEDLRGITRQLAARVRGPGGEKPARPAPASAEASTGREARRDARRPGEAGDYLVLAAGDGRRRAYVYVCARKLLRSLADKPACAGLRLELPSMEAGTYEVEFWDTWTGARAGRSVLDSRGGTLEVPLPKFSGDLAVKVRSREAGAAPAGTHSPSGPSGEAHGAAPAGTPGPQPLPDFGPDARQERRR